MKSHQRIAGAIALSVSILMCPKADAFTFHRIADTSNSLNFSSFAPGLSTQWSRSDWGTQMLNPDLGSAYQNQMGIASNSKGQTAYFAQLKNGGTALVLHDPAASPTNPNKTIATTNAQFSSFNPGISINENGEVAFSAVEKATGNTGIYVGNPTTTALKTIADTNSGFSSFAPGLSINDNGTVAFWGNNSSLGDKYKDVFIGNGSGNPINITKCSPSHGPVIIGTGIECPINAQRPSINNKGEVAFVGDNGVFKWDPQSQLIYNIMSDLNNFKRGSFHDPNINDLGQVSYKAWLENISSSSVLLNSDGKSNYLIAGNTEPIHSVGRSASINNMGEMAFIAEWNGYRDGQGYGIFTGMPDYMSPKYGGDNLKARADMMARDKVIAVGDPLLGSTVVALSIDRESRNDKDEITFWAKLANGIEGIFRAKPEEGDSQWNPLMPTSGTTGKDGTLWSFINTPGRIWYDPIPAEGFNFKMTSDSLFTEIMNFPANFAKPFILTVKDVVLGNFTAGDKVKFSDYTDLLGDLLKDGFGVQEFTISGISVDASSPTAFPIKLDFSTETASFDMIALLSKTESTEGDGNGASDPVDPGSGSEPVPEPTTIIGTLVFGAIAAKIKRQRALASKEI